jgi:hypothetical protein
MDEIDQALAGNDNHASVILALPWCESDSGQNGVNSGCCNDFLPGRRIACGDSI